MMINIVIPMAGAGSRFKNAGYSDPKPFIDIKGLMMIERVLNGVNLTNSHITLVIRESFIQECHDKLKYLCDKYSLGLISVRQITAGASCTVLATREIIDNSIPLLVVDSDNIFNPLIIRNFVDSCIKNNADGSLLTFPSNDPRFSFAEIDSRGTILQTAEKDPISNHAIAGAYFFSKGKDFVNSAIDTLIYGDVTHNEYYMSNVYNNAIKLGLKFTIYEIKKNEFDCVGTPDQLKSFLESFN